jgi:D-alanyl-D-alanine carboxypeptidase
MRKISLALLLFFCLLPLSTFAQVAYWLSDTLQATLNKRAKALNVKSVAAAVVCPDGSIWSGAYGMCGDVATSENFLFEMGSNTKTYTAAMILQLADEGKLKLDDTIYKYLPVYPNIGYSITIRQLLNHTSGIYNYTESDAFSNFVNGDPAQHADMETILNEWLDTMQFAPGTQWSYSNTNYILLGKIIEKLDGVPYEQALRKKLLDKFDFKESYLDIWEMYSIPKAGNWLGSGYYLAEDLESFMSAAWAAGAILTTPRDLALWAKKLYHGDILPGHWLDSMKTCVTAFPGYKYGLGMFQHTYNGKVYIGHGGTTLQNSEMDYSVSSDFSCVTVVNQQGKGNEAGAIQNVLINLMEKLLPKALSVTEYQKYSFKYYPNPVKDHFTFSPDADYILRHPSSRLNIYSLSGVLVKSVLLDGSHPVISRDNLPCGLYLIEVKEAGGITTFRDKLILQ